MVAIAAGQKDILRSMLDSALKILDVTGQNASIVLWAIENDHVTLLQVGCHKCHANLHHTVTLVYTSIAFNYLCRRYGSVIIRH